MGGRRSRHVAGASLASAWLPVIESLEGRSLFAATTIQPLPFVLEFDSDRGELLDKDGQGTGFTRLQANKLGTEYDASRIDLDTGAGVLKITTAGNSAAGGNYNGDNTLVNALETQFNATTSGWSVTTRLKGPLSFIDNPSEQAGIMFGPDQDNYVKLVAVAQPNGQFIQFIDEQTTGGVYSHALQGSNINNTYTSIGSFAAVSTLDLRLVGDAATGKVTAFYSVNGGAFVKIAQELTLTGTKKDQFFTSAARAGLIAMHKNDLGAMTATFERFEIQAGAVVGQRPSITASDPANGQVNVPRDAAVRNSVNLPTPGAGVDDNTLNANTVRLFRTSDGALVPGDIDTSGGGDTINFAPTVLLDPNTNYTFQITDGVKDTSGAAFVPYTITFTTGTTGGEVNTNFAFEKVTLNTASGHPYTAVKLGPDGKLYAASLDGLIQRFNVNADGTLGAAQNITSLQQAEGGNRFLTGIAFDPASTANNLVLWVSHSDYAVGLEIAEDWSGRISKLSGANLATVQHVVTNLPRSVRDHTTNQLAFGPDGKLYFAQGSQSAMGAPDNAWGLRPEHLLSGAVLRLDTSLVPAGTTLDAKTEEGGTYNPFAPNAPLTIYGRGVRNAYDLLWHSNGHLYVPTNGSAAGGNTPAGGGAPALTSVQETLNDYLFDVVQGGYYGHPNPRLSHYVLNGGNPTSGVDPGEVVSYPVGTLPDSNYRGFVYDFGENQSANGVIEYRSGGTAFGGNLDGKILVVRYSVGNDVVALTPGAGGAITGANVNIPGLVGFNDPLDLEVNAANGFIYVVEHGGQRITLARPITPGADASVDKTKLVYNDTTGSSTSQTQGVTLRNTGTGPLMLGTDAFSITGADASKWTLSAPNLPLTLQPGESVTVSATFRATNTRIYNASLLIKTSDPDSPTITVKLRGLGTSGTGGSNEPSLQRVLDLHEIPIFTGDADALTTFLYDASNPLVTPNDELVIPRFQKAGSGPVTMEFLAVFGASTGGTAFRGGYYSPGNPTDTTQLWSIGSNSEQSVAPIVSGSSSFDPGSAAFGLYVDAPKFGARQVFSEDVLNTWDPDANNRRKVRVYALRDGGGAVVPNAYVVAFEEAEFNTPDNQDAVYIIRNVKPAPNAAAAGPEIGYENLDKVPFNDRMVFARITTPDANFPNYVKDTGVLRVRNTGTSNLVISGMSITSTWEIVGNPALPITVPPNGGFVDLTLRFKATSGALQTGQLTITSNDADEPTTVIQLAGWRQNASENPEPTLAQHMQLFGYATTITKPGEQLANGGQVQRVGDEVLSPYWLRADASKSIAVRQLSAYHTQGDEAQVRFHTKGSTSTTLLFTHNAADGQTILPRTSALGETSATFNHTGTFGFRVDSISSDPLVPLLREWSDPALNSGFGDGGHHLRFFVARDRSGNVIPDTYLMVVDYAAINYDYQDNVYLISNIKPESGPGVPTGLTAGSTGAGIALNWNDNPEANLRGYNVYRSDAPDGAYTKLNATAVTSSDYLDTTAPIGATSYYRVVAVNLSGTESAAATASAIRVSDSTPPAMPTSLTATGTSGGIVLDWANNTEIDLAGYDVYRSGSLNGTYAKLNANLLTSSDFVDASAPANVASFYRIVAVDTSGNPSSPATASATRPASDTTAPATPTGLTGTGSQTGILIDWANNTEGDLAGYNIYRSDSQFGTYTKLNAAGLLTASQYNDTAAPAGQTSWYRVTAVDSSGNESLAAGTSAARPGDTTPPAAPTGLTLTGSQSGILLDWADNIEPDLAGYQVWRASSIGGPYTLLNPSAFLTSSTYNDTTAPAGQTSYYFVYAFDSSLNASDGAFASALRPAADAQAPAAPAGQSATVQPNGIALDWVDNIEPDLAGYNVYRAATAGGTYTKLNASLLTSSSFLDSTAPTGTSHYRITALDTAGNESTPAAVNVTRAASYTGADVNGATPPGSHTTLVEGADYNVTGGGSNITGSADKFYFLYQQLTGDFDLMVRLDSITNSDPSAKAGLMARESLIGGSRNVYMFGTVDERNRMSHRAATNGTTTTSVAQSAVYPNNYLRLKREGNTFTGYFSTDGVNWTQAAQVTLALPQTLFFGMAVTSKNSSQTATAQFRQLGSVGGAPLNTPPATPTGLSAVGSTNGIQLDWANNTEPDLAGYDVYRASSLNGTYTKLNASLLTSSDFLDTAAPAGQTSFYRVLAVDSAALESAHASASATRPSGDTTPPAVPQNLIASGNDAAITLDWSDNPELDLAGYNVYWSSSLNGTYAKLNAAPVTDSAYVDPTVAQGATRYYRITSVDTSGNESAPSSPASATRTGTSTTLTLAAVDDATVRGGSSAPLNFGSAATLEVKEADADRDRRAYMKFDLTGVSGVTSAVVRLFGYVADSTSPTAVRLNAVASDAWSEGAITFNNAPAVGAVIATQTATGVSPGTATWLEFDVTAYLQSALAAGKTQVTIAITTLDNNRVAFNSSEAAGNTPALVITT